MLNISPQELLLILLIALLVVGPRRLPELGRSLGKGIRELRKAQDEVRKTIQVDLDEDPRTNARRPATPPVASSAGDRDVAASADPGAVPGAVAGGDDAPASASGASEVSEVSRSLGRGIAELRRARKEIQRTFRVDLNEPRSKRPAETPRPTDDVAGGPVTGSPPE